MSTYNYKPGLGAVGSYQVSGIPYVTGALNCRAGNPPIRLTFPQVTRWIAIQNGDSGGEESEPLKVAFSENGLVSNFYEIGDMHTVFELKVTELWLSGSDYCCVLAGLTGIPNTAINNPNVSPDGANWSGSLGALVG